jgi:HAD superfamily hydrolase (TIGR01549 family)
MAARAVLWDFDRTLVRGWYLSECLVAMLDETQPNHGIPRENIARHLRTGFPWHRPLEPHTHLNDADAWWAAHTRLMADALLNEGVTEDIAMGIAGAARQRFFDITGYHVYPDTRPALERLSDEGWTHAIVSNHFPQLQGLVARLDLDGYFRSIVSSADVGYEKPRAEIFRIAIGALDDPEVLWMVGDDAERDVAAAGALGIPGILVDREAGTPGAVIDLGAAANRIEAGGDEATNGIDR